VLWYPLDETSGTAVTDAASGYNGTVGNLGDNTWDTTGGHDGGGCINLEAGQNTYVDLPGDALNFLSTATAVTFTAWVNLDLENPPAIEGSGSWSQIINAWKDGTGEVIETYIPSPWPRTVGDTIAGPEAHWHMDGDNTWATGMTPSDFGGRWNHFAFIKDTVSDTMKTYHNGQLVADFNDANTPFFTPPADRFHLGTRDPGWGWWYGKLDDVRAYDYALSAEEVAYIATDGTGSIYLTMGSQANLKSSTPEIIDMGDFAMIAQQWMTEQLWPTP
jgi:hypothetical protein